jgi:crotonobetainyl-CoA:carnitine CoA-transferase CaiB-like acyl-CoA transferase
MKKITIIDASTLLPGPFASYLLMKHLDCDVIKIEDSNQPDPFMYMRPTKDGIGLGYQAINKNKRILKVDFRNNGQDELKKEIAHADIFLENFKKGRAYKLGIAYEDLVKINPHILYCSISGYGGQTPLSQKSAHDLNILALSGYLDQSNSLGNLSVLPPMLHADIITAYHTTLSILSSYYTQDIPKHLEISMYEAFLEAMTVNNIPQLVTKKDFTAADYIMSGRLPCYGIYESQDGGYVAVAALEKPLWIDFCTHINRQDCIEKQFEPDVVHDIAKEMKKYNRMHWFSDDLDFCVTPVLSINEARKKTYV